MMRLVTCREVDDCLSISGEEERPAIFHYAVYFLDDSVPDQILHAFQHVRQHLRTYEGCLAVTVDHF